MSLLPLRLSRRSDIVVTNMSALPPGWTQDPNGNHMSCVKFEALDCLCVGGVRCEENSCQQISIDCGYLFFGSGFTDAVDLTTESCVAF